MPVSVAFLRNEGLSPGRDRPRILRLGWLVAMVLGGILHGANAEVRYFSPAGLHVPPFTNWTEAATNIQSAIGACAPGDTVVVTNGVFVLSATVRVTNQVTLTSLGGRETALLNGSGLPAGQDAVFLQFGTLDGLTISNAPRHGVKSEYGAVYNCRITHSGQSGIDSYTTPRVVTNSTLVVTNTIVRKSGTNGIYTCAVDTRILGCTITESGGSGVHLRQNDTVAPIQVPRVSNFLIRASTVSSNLNSGIMLVFWSYSAALPTVPVLVDNCLIERNSGVRGGGVCDGTGDSVNHASGVQITGCTIRSNTVTANGGGLYFLPNRSPAISHSLVEGNVAAGDGGGLCMVSGTAHNCLLRGNRAGNIGGGVRLGNLYNCTLVDNEAGGRGGGASEVVAGNCIFYYNRANLNSNVYASSVSYSCSAPLESGAGNTATAPGLAGVRNWRLVSDSPCIDSGSLAVSAGDYDLDGEPRIWGSAVDMGCDEFYPPDLGGPLSVTVTASASRAVAGAEITFTCDIEGAPEAYAWNFSDGFSASNAFAVVHAFTTPGVHTATVTTWNPDVTASNSVTVEIYPGYTNYVSLAGGHAHPFTNWGMAATNIQAAVAANIPGGVVLVADGVYADGGAAVAGGPTNRVALTNALAVRSLNGPAATTITGAGPGGDAAVRCAYLGAGARLSGFTLTGGHTWTTGDTDRAQSGGGAWCETGAIVENCWFHGNAASQWGGGVRGGTVWASILWDNTAVNGGGASGAALQQCILSNNTASGEGGGASGGALENSLVVNNQADYGGGVARAALTNATVANNQAAQSGGGAYRGTALNSILFFNTAGVSWSNYFNTVCQYSCTTPDPQSLGNVTNDPLFADAANGVYRLQGGSPAVDSAQNTGLAEDLLGVPRPLPGTLGGVPAPDMGAYEYTAAHYVAPGGAHVWPFLTWAEAAHDLQSAIDAADPQDVVFTSNGVFNTGGRAYRGALTNRVVVDKAIRLEAVNGHSVTVIEGSGPGGDAAIRGIFLETNALLSGFTVRNGATRMTGDTILEQSGGGIWAEPSARLSNCVVESCTANAFGGGVYGGHLANSFLSANTAAQGGGFARGEIEFCTVAGNTAVDGGGGYEGTGQFSIVYSNLASGSGLNIWGGTWASCCSIPDPGGAGHITNDPAFATPGHYLLDAGSPCIDRLPAGAGLLGRDLDGIPRPLDGDANGTAGYDLGASEHVHATADTDGEGLRDEDEIGVHGTNPLLPDTDGEGQSDRDEVIAGMDPLDPASYFAILSQTLDPVAQVISWPGRSGRLYTVISAPAPAGSWSNRLDCTDRPGADGIMAFTNPLPQGTNLFGVRVRLAP